MQNCNVIEKIFRSGTKVCLKLYNTLILIQKVNIPLVSLLSVFGVLHNSIILKYDMDS